MTEVKKQQLIMEHDPHFGVFYELMPFKVREILLVSSAYDAYIMEEDGSLAMRIINEYHGLNLSRPPRITRVSTVDQALDLLQERSFDLVMTMPHLGSMDCVAFARKIKESQPDLPVILLAHSVHDVIQQSAMKSIDCIDGTYIWCCDSKILLAIVKTIEDRINVDFDTKKGMVRVILYVEDSPVYRSQILPILYNEVVKQTQAVLHEGLNDQHRLLKMRARPKILTAGSYEEAIELFNRYRSNIYALLSDVRFTKEGKICEDAGIQLTREVRREVRDLPVLLLSSNPVNEELAGSVHAMFALKDPVSIQKNIHRFFLHYLGFGDFVFRMPEGIEVGRASTLSEFEHLLHKVPDESLMYHAQCNHFSNWVMARAEIALASRLSKHHFAGVDNPENLREDIIFKVHALRKLRQKGVVTQFTSEDFDPEVTDFVRIGNGSLGGKARGIAFVSSKLRAPSRQESLIGTGMVSVPQTCVITTEGFDDFIDQNQLQADDDLGDDEIIRRFESAELPKWLFEDLRAYLSRVNYPLSVRSSSMLEDAQFRPYAGLYSTFMLANSDPDFELRFSHLVRAVKLVYASTWFEGPRSFSRSIGQQNQDSMAVIIQRLVGRRYGNHFYPPVSGTVQSYNYYPFPPMKSEDGIAYIALGFGKTVVEGEQSLRFSPLYPENLPQLSSAEDMIKNTQRWFYSLDCTKSDTFQDENSNLVRRELDDATEDYPVRHLCSTYFPEEQRVRDADLPGPKVLTFAPLLKYASFPLAGIMNELITLGREGMGCEVEIEFALDLDEDPGKSVLHFLQIRPIVTGGEGRDVEITAADRSGAVLFCDQSLGHGLYDFMQDIVYVKPETFDTGATKDIATEIGKLNQTLLQEGRRYLLIGFGRWGTADPWLGIPVKWKDISGAGSIVEIQGHGVLAEPSQGSHFFQNITSLGIPYLMLQDTSDNTATEEGRGGRINWKWLRGLAVTQQTNHVCHARLAQPIILKVNGHTSESVVMEGL